MIRVLIDHQGDGIELPLGETVVGRDLSCQVRLNDPSVSRRHVRFRVEPRVAYVDDLGSRNGTLINGTRLKGSSPLSDGDQVQVGGRVLRVKIVGSAAMGTGDEPTSPAVSEGRPSLDVTTAESPVALVGPLGNRVPDEIAPPDMRIHNCPRCRRAVGIDGDSCPHCHYYWEEDRPHAITRVVPTADFDIREPISDEDERRSAPRMQTDIAVIYSSESLSFEAVARDLSRTGMFIATELLEPVATNCRITLLVDGAPAMAFSAMVTRVVEKATEGVPPGLGTRFVGISPEGQRWLVWLLTRLDAPKRPTELAGKQGSGRGE